MTDQLINISDNDKAKFQGYLDEIANAYTTSRTGAGPANKSVIARTSSLKEYLDDLHKQSTKADEDDAKLLPMLEDRLQKFDTEIKAAKTTDEKKSLQTRKENVQVRINEIKTLLKK